MVIVVEGNLLNSPAQVITNAVNCVGVMGKGIALDFKKQFPMMFEDYQQRCEKSEVRVGHPYLWQGADREILNFPTKLHWKDPSRLSYIEQGLQFLALNYDELGISSIAMPALGCGLGGLKWDDVLPLVEKYLGPIPTLDVFIYKPKSADAGTGKTGGNKDKGSTVSDGIAAQPSLY